MTTTLNIYRNRIIPKESISLKNDVVLCKNNEIIVTKWTILKPRSDFQCGYSIYYKSKGFKLSKFLKEDLQLFCWYCDIIEVDPVSDHETFSYTDLLLDLRIKPDGTVDILDLDELALALKEQLITVEQAVAALTTTNKLQADLKSGVFETYQQQLEYYIKHSNSEDLCKKKEGLS